MRRVTRGVSAKGVPCSVAQKWEHRVTGLTPVRSASYNTERRTASDWAGQCFNAKESKRAARV